MQAIKNFKNAHQVLASFIPPAHTMRDQYTLNRMLVLMEKLGNPQEKYKTIHVAGTSGKTSTCYYIAALLGQTDRKIGLTVSPHIDEINERLQIDLTPLPEEIYCKKLSEFMELLNKLSIKPTYFELLIAFAYWQFAREKVKYAVVEVGLGGLLDGTNVIKRSDKVCAITDIGLDHTKVLGNDIERIAAQKAGIIQSGNEVFSYKQDNDISQSLREATTNQNANLHELDYSDHPEIASKLPLFQQRNWNLAEKTIEYVLKRDKLPLLTKPELLKTTETYIPARMEVIRKGNKTIILDGAHNPQKTNVLVESLRERFPNTKMSVLLGLLSDKDLPGVLREITPIASNIVATSFRAEQDMPRGSITPEEIVTLAKKQGFENIESLPAPKEAFNHLLMESEDIILIVGSFYLLNHIRPLVFSSKSA